MEISSSYLYHFEKSNKENLLFLINLMKNNDMMHRENSGELITELITNKKYLKIFKKYGYIDGYIKYLQKL